MVPKLGFYQDGGGFAQKAKFGPGGKVRCLALEMEEVIALLSSAQDSAGEKGAGELQKIKRGMTQICRGLENSYREILGETEVV